MGTNVALLTAVPGTTITSASYNQNLVNINTAGQFTYTTGSISQFGSLVGAGSGTYQTSCTATGNNMDAVIVSWRTSSVTTENQTVTGVGDTTFTYGSTAGKVFGALYYKS